MQKMRSDYAKPQKPFRSQATKKGIARTQRQKFWELMLAIITTGFIGAVITQMLIEFFNQF